MTRVSFLSVVTPDTTAHFADHLASIAALDPAAVDVIITAVGLTPADMANLELVVDEVGAAVRVHAAPKGATRSEILDRSMGLSTSEFVVPLTVKDRVAPSLLADVANDERLWGKADLLYGDEELVGENGATTGTVYRPGWSLELHLQANVVGPSPLIRRESAVAAGGFTGHRNTGVTQDLALRLHDQGAVVRHVPVALVRRGGTDSPDVDADVVAEWCSRRGETVEVGVQPAVPGALRLIRRVAPGTRVSVIVPTRGTADPGRGPNRYLVESLIESVERTTERDRDVDLEYVLVCDEGMPGQVREGVRALASRPLRFVEHVRGPEGFNFARMVNEGAFASSGDVLVFVNDDVAMLTEGWLHDVVPLAHLPGVGAIGIRLVFPDRTIQHLGFTISQAGGGWPVHQNCGVLRDDPANGGWLGLTREVVAVTGAFLVIARSRFLEVGGFSTAFPINHNDVDLCLKLAALGYRSLVIPRVTGVHAESSTREPGATDAEKAQFQARWGASLARDPYRNPRVSWLDMSPLGA